MIIIGSVTQTASMFIDVDTVTFKILEFTLAVFIACAFIDLIRQGLFWSVTTTIKIACAKTSNLFKKTKKPNTIKKMGG